MNTTSLYTPFSMQTQAAEESRGDMEEFVARNWKLTNFY
jgi:hypothetical protein